MSKMTATLACHIFFSQSPFLTKIVGLDSNSNLVEDEVEKLSSWKFFKWNRFGNRISPPK